MTLSCITVTEIDEAFKLYWRVGVDPKQMVMGM